MQREHGFVQGKIERFSDKLNYVTVSKMSKSGVWGTDIKIMVLGSTLYTSLYT